MYSHLHVYIFNFVRNIKNLPNIVQSIYTNSSIWLGPILQDVDFSLRNQYFNIYNEKTTSFLEKKLLSLELLKYCNRTAFVFPKARIIETENMLRLHGINRVSVINEALVARRLAFHLPGWVPRFLQVRIRGLQNSGIIEWWNDFISKYLVNLRSSSQKFWKDQGFVRSNFEVQKKESERSQHIFRVHLALLLGLVLATLCLVFEILVGSVGFSLQKILTTIFERVNVERYITKKFSQAKNGFSLICIRFVSRKSRNKKSKKPGMSPLFE